MVVRIMVGGVVKTRELPRALVEAARRLPHQPDRYFLTTADSVEIPVGSLVHDRLRPDGLANAVVLMAEAYADRQAPRAPIDVRRMEDGDFLIVDGNSTAAVAAAAGWPTLPCLLVDGRPGEGH